MDSPSKENIGQKKRSASKKGDTGKKRPKRSCTKSVEDKNDDGGSNEALDIVNILTATDFNVDGNKIDSEERMVTGGENKHGKATSVSEREDDGDNDSTNKNIGDDDLLTDKDGNEKSNKKADRAAADVMTPVSKNPVSKNIFSVLGKHVKYI